MDNIYLKHINKQISILRKQNLKIDDYEFIEYVLKNENFFGILNGYRKPFLENHDLIKNKFIDNATFENIYALYEFDIQLKSILIKNLIKVESTIKSFIYQVFYKHHGDNTPLKLSNFNSNSVDNPINLNFINRKILENIALKTDIAYYSTKYGIIPLWSIINILNFEELFKFYLIMKENEKEEVANKVHYNLNKKEFKKYFNILVETKKICFQNNPMYDFISLHKLSFIDTYSNFNYIPESKSNVFTIVIILKILLSNENFKEMFREILSQLDYLSHSLKNLKHERIYEKICEGFMGIPVNFETLNI